MKQQHHFSLGAHILYCLAFILFMIVMIGVTPPRRLISMQQGQGGMRKTLGGPMYFEERERAKGELGMELYPTGSSLPDCSHACGPCFPCKRVMVSFKCSTESCPIVYRCTCKGKYYHVPSN